MKEDGTFGRGYYYKSIESKFRIYKTVWQEEYMYDDKNLTAYINKIRKKLEQDPKNPEFIRTVWGVGYKFMG